MTKHYVLNLSPDAQYKWDRCILRDPLTAERPDLEDLIAQAVGEEAGSYLIAVNIEVKVLEKTPTKQSEQVPTQKLQPSELVA